MSRSRAPRWQAAARLARAVMPCLLAAGIAAAEPWSYPAAPRVAAEGIGGTGIQYDGKGIGGTGFGDGIGGTGGPVYRDGRGIGGTGIEDGIGGTGIIGTITGFGSIVVNGAHVQYDNNLPVESLDGPASAQDFRVGHVVAIEAFEQNGVLRARNARIRFPVAGQVTNIDTRRNRIEVLGRWVQMSPDVLINDDTNPNMPPIIGIGDYVQVSGLTRPDGIIDASRVERRRFGRARIVGDVSSVDRRGFTIGEHHIAWPNGRMVTGFAPGKRVVVTGQYSHGRLIAERLRVRPDVPFGGRYRHLLVEGFVQQYNRDYRLRGLTVNPRALQSNTGFLNRRVIVGGFVERNNRLRTTTFRLPTLRELRRQQYDRPPSWRNQRNEGEQQRQIRLQREQRRQDLRDQRRQQEKWQDRGNDRSNWRQQQNQRQQQQRNQQQKDKRQQRLEDQRNRRLERESNRGSGSSSYIRSREETRDRNREVIEERQERLDERQLQKLRAEQQRLERQQRQVKRDLRRIDPKENLREKRKARQSRHQLYQLERQERELERQERQLRYR